MSSVSHRDITASRQMLPVCVNEQGTLYFSAWFRQHFPKGHGVFAASDEHGYLLHWQSKEVPAEQRSKWCLVLCLLNIVWNWNHYHWVLMDLLGPYLSCMTDRDPASCLWGNWYKLHLLLSVWRVNKKLTRTGLGWKRTSSSWLTCRDRRLPSPAGRRRSGRRRSESWTKRIPRNSGGWRWGECSHCYRLLADPS